MARVDLDQPLQPSVLDRLLDDQPDKSVDPPKSRGQSLAELRAAVRRDLEILLNTRHRCRSWHTDLKELKGSLLNYGIPEFTSANMASDTAREEFRFAIEEVIKRCEPRFQSVEVVLLDNADRLDRTIRFRIEALMYADPAPEPVVFDSAMEPSTQTVLVKSSAHG